MSEPIQQNHGLNDTFIQALSDINVITGNVGQIAGLVNSIINARNANQEYIKVQNQLAMVMIQREMIMRRFDSIDNFIRLAYQERSTVLEKAEALIKQGLKKKKHDEVLVGLQIIKAIFLTNPLNKNTYDSGGYKAAYELLDSSII